MKTNTLLFKALIIAIIFPLFTGSIFAQKKIQLKYKLRSGDKYDYSINLNQDIDLEANGQSMTLNQTMTFNILMKIENGKEPKTFDINSTINRLTMKQSVYGMDMFYDSGDSTTYASGTGKQLGDQLNKLIGKHYTTSIDEYGNIKAIDVSELLANSDVSNKINQNTEFSVFPQYKVGVGDSWETDASPLANKNMKVHTKYTLLKIKRKTAIIGFESTISSSGDNDTKINGTQKGELTVNRKTGWTIHSTIEQELKLEIEQNGMKIPANISGTIETNSKRL